MQQTGAQLAFLSMGCPASIGPEVALKAALEAYEPGRLFVILGDVPRLRAVALQLQLHSSHLRYAEGAEPRALVAAALAAQEEGVLVVQVGEPLAGHASWGQPSQADGVAQLTYVEEGYALAKAFGAPLVTAAVSKEAIAHCGLARAQSFRGHTEWLEALDGADYSVMCFASERLLTSLCTTHIPVRKIADALTPELVCRAIVEATDLAIRLRHRAARVFVASLNPHGGEGELLGKEEGAVIVPGIEQARAIIAGRAEILGLVGAETAYRKTAAGAADAVVAMYHDQATIPMKLLDFGSGVNITQGLSIVRTSVDHGTAYDIAGKGIASAKAMLSALHMALRLAASERVLPTVQRA